METHRQMDGRQRKKRKAEWTGGREREQEMERERESKRWRESERAREREREREPHHSNARPRDLHQIFELNQNPAWKRRPVRPREKKELQLAV